MGEEGLSESVVLVHGLWMTGIDMALLRHRLHRCGFDVYLFRYPSLRGTVAENAARLAAFVERRVPGDIVHFVGHSLGGLVIRRLVLDRPDLRPGRIVTLGTPHRGSRAAERLCRNLFGRMVLGCSVSVLLGELPGWSGERAMGSIAGTLGVGIGRFLASLPQPNDGTVALDETRMPGLADFVAIHATHTGLLFSPEVARQTCAFLRDGAFLGVSRVGPLRRPLPKW